MRTWKGRGRQHGLVPIYAKDGDVQPRLRSLVWREMPPCVRRIYLACSRRLFYVQLFFSRLQFRWSKSPTWNFVGVMGTIGILLTILLFLTSWSDDPSLLQGKLSPQIAQRKRPSWDVDSRLVATRSPKPPAYPVEFQFDDHPPQLAVKNTAAVKNTEPEEESPRPRRRRSSDDDQPPVVELPKKESEDDWFAKDEPQPPKLELELEVVTAAPRRTKTPEIADATWTGRTVMPTESSSEFDPSDEADDHWQLFDDTKLTRSRRRHAADHDVSHETVAASQDEQPRGEAWQPLAIPEDAPSITDVQLEVSWDRTKSARRGTPQFHLRNLGSDPIERIDVIAGQLPEADWSSPADFTTQPISHLTAGKEESVPLPSPSSQRRSSGDGIISVLVTAFVGSSTQVNAAVAERPRPTPARMEVAEQPQPKPRPTPNELRIPIREPDRPHLTMTVGTPGKMPLEKMVSVPIRVINDGNVTLYDVVIVAEVPATLDHQYGRTVHYRLGKMQANEQKRATLLLTPLESGSSTVPMKVADGKRTASDTGEVGIDVAEHEVADKALEKNAEKIDEREGRPRRRRSMEREEPTTPQRSAEEDKRPTTQRARDRDVLPKSPRLPAEDEQPKAKRSREKESDSRTESIPPATTAPHADFGGAP